VLLYISVNDKIAHIDVQLLHNDRFSNCVLLYSEAELAVRGS